MVVTRCCLLMVRPTTRQALVSSSVPPPSATMVPPIVPKLPRIARFMVAHSAAKSRAPSSLGSQHCHAHDPHRSSCESKLSAKVFHAGGLCQSTGCRQSQKLSKLRMLLPGFGFATRSVPDKRFLYGCVIESALRYSPHKRKRDWHASCIQFKHYIQELDD